MAAPEFLATKEENENRSPIKAIIYWTFIYCYSTITGNSISNIRSDNQVIFGLELHIQALTITLYGSFIIACSIFSIRSTR